MIANAIEESLAAVKTYVRKTNGGNLEDEKIENIFKYVMPKSILYRTAKHVKQWLLCVITNLIWNMV